MTSSSRLGRRGLLIAGAGLLAGCSTSSAQNPSSSPAPSSHPPTVPPTGSPGSSTPPTTSRSLITSYMRAAAAAGSYNVGGPYQLSGATYFSDNTHHDHIHAGFQT